jgi:hypothetical protein
MSRIIPGERVRKGIMKMNKINMRQALKDAQTKYRSYSDPRRYSPGSALDLAVQDQVRKIWNEEYPGDTCPDLSKITGNLPEPSDREGYDTYIQIDRTWRRYDNNGGSVVLKALKR